MYRLMNDGKHTAMASQVCWVLYSMYARTTPNTKVPTRRNSMPVNTRKRTSGNVSVYVMV
ncbi:MAG: hypothetical protein P4M11_15950 [Candidatus Pacebacteria bacterium]|nr:hypothetical protein [Candidatus Paceibacterota bacterium]